MTARGAVDTRWRCVRPPPAAGRLPTLDLGQLIRGFDRVVVVAPHPDDETLGVAGLLSMLLQRGFPIEIILVTDGEASHRAAGRWSMDGTRHIRVLENRLALHAMGWAHPPVRHLAFPDRAVANHEQALAEQLAALLRVGDRVFTTWEQDGHADHEATARAVLAACVRTHCVCTQFPVWQRTRLLEMDDDSLHPRLACFPFDEQTLRRKARALGAYRSQIVAAVDGVSAPVIPPTMVQQFLVPFEVLML